MQSLPTPKGAASWQYLPSDGFCCAAHYARPNSRPGIADSYEYLQSSTLRLLFFLSTLLPLPLLLPSLNQSTAAPTQPVCRPKTTMEPPQQ